MKNNESSVRRSKANARKSEKKARQRTPGTEVAPGLLKPGFDPGALSESEKKGSHPKDQPRKG